VRTNAGLFVTGLTIVAGSLWFGQPAMAQTAHPDKPGMGCASCHVPHKALKEDTVANGTAAYGVPLWNPAAVTTASFTVFSSPSFDALATGITQPDGPSKLCLGCHDGGSYGVANGITTAHSFNAGGGMSLTTMHPVSFVFDVALTNNPNLKVPGELKNPVTTVSGLSPAGTVDTDMLDKNHKVQCTSCHDIHSNGAKNVGTWDLRIDYTDGKTLCQKCHNK
jgi:hypothetical protein